MNPLNKYVPYIIASVAVLIPLIGILYGYWDSSQPRTGPVGNGTQAVFSPAQLIVLIGAMLTGGLNLIIAIKTYLEHKKTIEKEKKNIVDQRLILRD